MEKEKYLQEIRKVTNGSPYYRLLGMEITDMREGESVIRMPFRKELTHPYGIVHGGAIASLADSAVAMALISMVGWRDRITTIEFKINFLASISEGELTAQAKIIHRGSQTAVGDVAITNAEGKLVAKAVATYIILRSQD